MNRERSDRVVRRFVLVTLVLPVVVTTVGLMVQLAVLPQRRAIPVRGGRAERLGPVWLRWSSLSFSVSGCPRSSA